MKTMLRANRTYRSPDGELVVTPARIKHWAESFMAMRRKGLRIPSSWDHSDDPAKDVPVKFAAGDRRRLPQGTVGYLHSLTPTQDGNAAEVVVEVRRKPDAEMCDQNLAYISPVIRSEWTDGDGQVWKDVWGHVDLVQHPVDHRQTPFSRVDENQSVACALRMGLDEGQPKTYHLQAEDADMADNETGDRENQEMVENEGNRLKKVIEILAKMDVILSDDTNEENFLEHLEQALLTAAAQNDAETEQMTNEGEELEVTSPQFAAMSLERRREKAYMDKQHRGSVAKRLSALLEHGRCTPAEYKAKAPALQSVRLSLDDNGNAIPTQLESWIESRESVPKGTFWSAEQRTRLAGLDEVPHPADIRGQLDDKEADEAADYVFRARR